MMTLVRIYPAALLATLREAAAGRISSELMSITPTQRMETITATATSIVNAYSVMRGTNAAALRQRRVDAGNEQRVKQENPADDRAGQRQQQRQQIALRHGKHVAHQHGEYLANAPPRESTTRPSAIEVEENTLMIVSALILE